MGPSAADIANVAGGAFGAQVSVSLGGEPPVTSAARPSVTLPLTGEPVNATAPSASVHGPDQAAAFAGRLLDTAKLAVSSQGSAAWRASTSHASVTGLDALAGALRATQVRSTCSSSEEATSGSAKVTGGTLALTATERIPLPEDPAPNTRFGATDAASGSAFTVVLNEQLPAANAITVTAVHIRVEGPSAVGDIVVGRSWCAVKASGAAAPTDPAAPAGAAAAPPGTAAGAPRSGAATSAGAGAAPAAAGVALPAAAPAPRNSACGYFVNVGLFGGPQTLQGCGQPAGAPAGAASPSVTLPPGGSTDPVTAVNADGAAAKYGPATIFGGLAPANVSTVPPSGPISVSTQGNPNGGTVTSKTDIVLRTPPDPASPGGFGPAPVEGDEMHVSCSASPTAVTGSTRVVNGVLSVTTTADGSPKDAEKVPENPPVNYTRSGVITNVGDVFTAVYNEHIVNADGSLTVNGVHMYLFGPTAVGEMVKGQVNCGTTPSATLPEDTAGPTCGPVVVAPSSPTDPTPRVPRTELIGVFDTGGLQSITNVQVTNGTVQTGDPNPAVEAYLRFTPGQTGPLRVVATRTEAAEAANLPLTWSFDATDVAGNVTRSTQCPTSSVLATGSVIPPGGATGTAGGTGTGGNAGTGAGGSANTGASRAAIAKTGSNRLQVAFSGAVLVAGGTVMVLATRRRRLAKGDQLPPGEA